MPSGSHDVSRISLNRTQKELELIFVFLMTMPTIPCVYYGDEIGMEYIAGLASKEGGYSRTGSRTPMQWSTEKNAGFSKANKAQLYLPIKTPYKINVQAQRSDPNSLLNKVRQLIDIRKKSPALRPNSKFEIIYAKSKRYPFVYLRNNGKETYLVVLNPSDDKEVMDLNICKNMICKAENGVKIKKTNCGINLHMEPISYGIFCI